MASPTQKRRLTGRPRRRMALRVAQEQDWLCATCGGIFPWGRLELDHVVPLNRGGSNDRSNLQILCTACHAAKTDRELGRPEPPKPTAVGAAWDEFTRIDGAVKG